MRLFKHEAKRRISWLIAEKSTKRTFIGGLSKAVGSIPVARALDKVTPARGRIFLPDQDNDPCLIQGVGTNFKSPDFQIGGLIVLPKVGNQTPSTEIGKIVSDTELRLKKPFKTPEAIQLLTGSGNSSGRSTPSRVDQSNPQSKGCSFKVAPYVDQSKVYDAVFDELDAGGVVGIFPEGGSHDRPDLLPLKPGVAIMALGALANNPDCGVKIIPIGMNYFHAHKFRSRAVVEIGHPIEVSPEQVEAYKSADRRSAVGSLLETVYQGLVGVTQSSPDYDTLMLIQAARRLYNPIGKKLPLSVVVELNRRLVKGYTTYKDHPRVVELKRDVLDYNRRLRALGVRDHQLEWGNTDQRPWYIVLGTLFYRLGELLALGIGVLPGLAMFWPVFVTTKIMSYRKAKEALAASTVKLQGRDVITTWKLLVAMAVAPALYAYYTIIVSLWLVYNRRDGYYTHKVPTWMVARTWVPDWVPIWIFAVCFIILCLSVTFAALRIGEIGMDVVKSLPPLFVALNPRSAGSLTKLRKRRQELANRVTNLINDLGPEVYPDFDANRIVPDKFRDNAYQSMYRKMPATPTVEEASEPPTPTSGTFEPRDEDSGALSQTLNLLLPSNEAFRNIGNFGFFASRPQTPKTRSRSSSVGGGTGGLGSGDRLKGFSALDSHGSFDEVSKRIRGAMRERGRRRETENTDHTDVTEGTESSWEDGQMPLTPGTEESEEAKKDR
jgi:glycerol-3-phosphate O-acyltransferase / dihydroxyacetone phosphate acyltransferase